jgi:hypothetical protein
MQFFEHVRTLWASLGVFCAQHPPLLRQPALSDTFIAVAGLFSADDPQVYAQTAVEFAKDVLSEIQTTETELRVLIGIAVGGPLLCGLAGTTGGIFNASGAAIEDAISLAEVSAPNKVLVSGSAKELLTEVDFDPGGDPIRGYFVRFPNMLMMQKRADKIVFGSSVTLPSVEIAAGFELPDIEQVKEPA